MITDFRLCEYFFLPVNPVCVTTTTSSSTTTSTTTTEIPSTSTTTTSSTSTTTSSTTTTSTSSTSTTTTTSIPTTTTTTTNSLPVVTACGVFLVTPSGDVYDYEPNAGTCTFLMSTGTSAVDIANTNTKLWTCLGNTLKEYDITLNPFTYSFNRWITFSASLGVGLTVKSEDDGTGVYELIGGGNPNYIRKFTITPTSSSHSLIFQMGTDRSITGDIIYNAITDTYLIANYSAIGYIPHITEFRSDGTKVFDIVIAPTSIYGLYVYDGVNYAVNYSHQIYEISPSGITQVGTVPMIAGINGSSQNVTCINATTTTTTTNLSTTTTTTTINQIVNCLDGLVIETIYLHFAATDIPLLPEGYTHPCPSTISSHVCNRAFFELYGNGVYMADSLLNNLGGTGGAITYSGKNTCTDYLNHPDDFTGGTWTGNQYSRYSKTILTQQQAIDIANAGGGVGTTIQLSFLSAMTLYSATCDVTTTPHSGINWLRISTADGMVLWNSCVEGDNIYTIDVCATTTTTTTIENN